MDAQKFSLGALSLNRCLKLAHKMKVPLFKALIDPFYYYLNSAIPSGTTLQLKARAGLLNTAKPNRNTFRWKKLKTTSMIYMRQTTL
jgi:hypothetical protein